MCFTKSGRINSGKAADFLSACSVLLMGGFSNFFDEVHVKPNRLLALYAANV